MSLLFLTENKQKIKEFATILNKHNVFFTTPTNEQQQYMKYLTEIQSIDVTSVSIDKLKKAYDLFKCPCFVEDTGLYLDDLPTRYPGALIKFVHDAHGNKGIADLYKGKRATVETVISLTFDGQTIFTFRESLKGIIADYPIGSNGFGFDSIFALESQTLHPYVSKNLFNFTFNSTLKYVTYAQLTDQEKSIISHRTRAINQLIDFLNKYTSQ